MKIDEKENIIDLIKRNELLQFQIYIKENNIHLKEINNENFDLLTFAIENKISIQLINEIIEQCQYKNLNYTFCEKIYKNEKYIVKSEEQKCYIIGKYKVPLFLAFLHKYYSLIYLLLKQYHADINYTFHLSIIDGKNNKRNKNDNVCHNNNSSSCNKTEQIISINILHYLIAHDNNFMHISDDIFIFIFKCGFHWKGITAPVLIKLIQNNKNKSLEYIYNHYIYDHQFILYFIGCSKQKRAISRQQLQNIVDKEWCKIDINNEVYDAAIKYHNGIKYCNVEALNILLDFLSHRCNYNNNNNNGNRNNSLKINKTNKINRSIDMEIINKICNDNVVTNALEKNNESLLKKLFSFDGFDLHCVNFELHCLEAIDEGHLSMLKLLLNTFISWSKTYYNNSNNSKNNNEHMSSSKNINNNNNTNNDNKYDHNFEHKNKLLKLESKSKSIYISKKYSSESPEPGFETFDFEKLLMVASSKNKYDIMNYLLEILLNISMKTLEDHSNTYSNLSIFSFLPSNIKKRFDIRFLILLINISIKTHHIKIIQWIMENEEFQGKISIFDKDKNDDSPILTAFKHISTYSDGPNIFNYLLSYEDKHMIMDNNGDINNFSYGYNYDSIKHECMKYLLTSAINKHQYLELYYLFKYPIPIYEESESESESEFESDFDEMEDENSFIVSPVSASSFTTNTTSTISFPSPSSPSIFHPILKAIYKGDLSQVQSIIESRDYQLAASFNLAIYSPVFGFTPLILAYLLKDKNNQDGNSNGNNQRNTRNRYQNKNNNTQHIDQPQAIFDFLLNYSKVIKVNNGFINNGININELDRNGYSLLHYAILKDDLTMVKDLIQRGVDINYKENKSCRGNSAIDIAIYTGNMEIFKVIMNSSKNIQLNVSNEFGITPLVTVIKKDIDEIMDKNNSDIDNNNNNKNKILDIKDSKNNNKNKNRNNDNSNNNRIHSTPEEVKKLKMIKILLDKGADVNFVDSFGYSVLMHAIKSGSLCLVKYLVEHGADIHFRMVDYNNSFCCYDYIDKNMRLEELKEGKSILMYAIELDKKEIIDYFMKCPEAISMNLEEELIYYDVIDTVFDNKNFSILLSLIRRPHQFSPKFQYQQILKHRHFIMKLLKEIIIRNDLPLLKYIIESDSDCTDSPAVIDINEKDEEGETLLTYAIRINQSSSIVQYLIDKGIDLHQKINDVGQTVEDLCYEIYQYYLQQGDKLKEEKSFGIYKKIKRYLLKSLD